MSAVLAALTAGAAAPPRAHAECVLVVVWHDRAYLSFGDGPPASERRRALAGAMLPDCADSGMPAGRPTPVAAHRIAGMSPVVAIVSQGETLVGAGYLIGTTELPIGSTGRRLRDETRDCTLGGSVQVVGRARPGVGVLDVSVDRSTAPLRGAAQIFADGHTRIEGLTRNGFPYVGAGQRVRVDTRLCRVDGSTSVKMVARRIAPAGPIVPASSAADVLGADWRGSRVDAVVAPHGYGWKAGVALVLAAAIGALLILRRRSPRSGG